MVFNTQEEVYSFFLCLATGTTVKEPIVIKEGDSFKLILSKVSKKSLYDIEIEYKILTKDGREYNRPKTALTDLETALRQFNSYQEKMRF